MELSDYRHILRRWWLLIAAGTIVGLAVGAAIEYHSRTASATRYQAAADVTINYAVLPYQPNMSLSAAANALITHINDPGVLQVNPRLPAPSGVVSLTASVDPSNDQIVVQAIATSRATAILAANRGARYLVGLENTKVTTAAGSVIRSDKKLVAHDRGQYFYFSSRYARLNASGLGSPAQLAHLSSAAGYWQNVLNQDRGNLNALLYPGAPPSQMTRVLTTKPVTTKSLSLMKTVVPAAIVGLALSFMLAAFLESRRRRSGEGSEPMDEIPGQTIVKQPLADVVPPSSGVPVMAAAAAGPLPADAVEPSPLASEHPHPNGNEPHSDSVLVSPEPDSATTAVEPVSGLWNGTEPVEEKLLHLAGLVGHMGDSVMPLLNGSGSSLFVTNSSHSEPKADIALGLSAALALRGLRVAIVDADPTEEITAFFNLTHCPGLSDYLGYPEGSITQFLYPCDLSLKSGQLSVVPYGNGHEQPIGLVPTGTMKADVAAWSSGLRQLAGDVDAIIVNGPSVLESPLLIAPAAEMGGAIVVVSDEESGGDDSSHVTEVLRSFGVRVLGTVTMPGPVALNGNGAAKDAGALERPEAPAIADLPKPDYELV